MIKHKLKVKKFATNIFCFILIYSTVICSVYSDNTIKKDESVYVTLDHSGNPKDIIISDWIQCSNVRGSIYDRSILQNIVNIKGYEVPTIEGDMLIWNGSGKDIFYQGTVKKQMPLNIVIKYYLNEKQIKPEELSGKSGNFRIIIKIENRQKQKMSIKGKTRELYTPFITATIINLPIKNFSDIKVNSGDVISDANNQVITFISSPGLRESIGLNNSLLNIEDQLILNAKVRDFQMGSIMITATPSIPDMKLINGTKEVDSSINVLSDLRNAGNQLSKGSEALSKGQKELQINMGNLNRGADQLNLGATELNKGMIKLNEGIKAAHEGAFRIKDGVIELVDNAGKIADGASSIGETSKTFSQKAMKFANKFSQSAQQSWMIADKAGRFSDEANSISEASSVASYKSNQIQKNTMEYGKELEKIKEETLWQSFLIDRIIGGLKAIEKFTRILGTEGVNEYLKIQRVSLEELQTANDNQLNHLNRALAYTKVLNNQLFQLNQEIKEMEAKSVKLNDNIKAVSESSKTLRALTGNLKDDSIELSIIAKKLEISSNMLKKGTESFAEGSKELVAGSTSLSDGLGQLSTASEQLKSGTEELSKGSLEMATGTSLLNDGAKKLSRGTEELNNGINKFNIEGIDKFKVGLSAGIKDLEEVMLVKDELLKLSKNYGTFSGLGENMTGSVKFIMRTDEIKAKAIPVTKTSHIKKEEEGFLKWLIAKYWK